MKLNYPKVNTNPNQKVFISFFIENKRYRLYNGSRIGSETNPNSFPFEQRKSIGNLLAAEVYNYLINGGLLLRNRKPTTLVLGFFFSKKTKPVCVFFWKIK